MRELDRVAIEEHGIPGITLMKRAGQATVDTLFEKWPDTRCAVVFCGTGNNAGDGYIIGGLLADKGVKARVVRVGRKPEPGTDAGDAYAFCESSSAEITDDDTGITDYLDDADVVVDALLGTGIAGRVRENYAAVITAINDADLPVLAVDLPSGLCADTGRILGCAIKADATVTFIGRKLGLYTNNGSEHCGEVVFDGLGVPATVFTRFGHEHSTHLLTYREEINKLKPRHRNAHKRSHGHLLVIAGNEGMGGAAIMAAEAALMSGAGLVSVATVPSNVPAILARRPELMPRGVTDEAALVAMANKSSAVVCGPGLGGDAWARMVLGCAIESGLPGVFDADALNLIAETGKFEGAPGAIFTPHPGEAARLLPGVAVQEDRMHAVQTIRAQYGAVTLLKGAGTLIAGPAEVSLCPYGNPGMSVGGMGDVLSGVIGALLAQGLPAEDAARVGAVVHSLAADKLVALQGERGLLATELLPAIRRLINGGQGTA